MNTRLQEHIQQSHVGAEISEFRAKSVKSKERYWNILTSFERFAAEIMRFQPASKVFILIPCGEILKRFPSGD